MLTGGQVTAVRSSEMHTERSAQKMREGIKWGPRQRTRLGDVKGQQNWETRDRNAGTGVPVETAWAWKLTGGTSRHQGKGPQPSAGTREEKRELQPVTMRSVREAAAVQSGEKRGTAVRRVRGAGSPRAGRPAGTSGGGATGGAGTAGAAGGDGAGQRRAVTAPEAARESGAGSGGGEPAAFEPRGAPGSRSRSAAGRGAALTCCTPRKS